MVAKEKKIKIHTPGFWLTLEDHVFGGCVGQSLEKEARDCSCFFMQRQVFAQKISSSSLRNGCQPQGNVVSLWRGKDEFYM